MWQPDVAVGDGGDVTSDADEEGGGIKTILHLAFFGLESCFSVSVCLCLSLSVFNAPFGKVGTWSLVSRGPDFS